MSTATVYKFVGKEGAKRGIFSMLVKVFIKKEGKKREKERGKGRKKKKEREEGRKEERDERIVHR
jgi:hypothetical protein